jgi:hypothetical protein
MMAHISGMVSFLPGLTPTIAWLYFRLVSGYSILEQLKGIKGKIGAGDYHILELL